jgi:hypothetical protein
VLSSQRAPKLDTLERQFGGFPALPDRHREAGWGRSPCHHSYWKAPWAILEDEFECLLVNAQR